MTERQQAYRAVAVHNDNRPIESVAVTEFVEHVHLHEISAALMHKF